MPAVPDTYTSLSDEALMELLSQQDELAFRAIYQRYADQLYKTAFNRLPVVHKAGDFVQEVFIALYRNRFNQEKIVDLKAWLFTCLRNCILNEIRNLNTHKSHNEQIAANTPLTTVNNSQCDLKLMEVQFHKALLQLTGRSREVFVLSRIEHLPNKIIAAQLHISVPTVEKHITSALRVMRRALGKYATGIFLLAVTFTGHH